MKVSKVSVWYSRPKVPLQSERMVTRHGHGIFSREPLESNLWFQYGVICHINSSCALIVLALSVLEGEKGGGVADFEAEYCLQSAWKDINLLQMVLLQ